MNEHHITTGTVDLSEGENPLWNTFHISVVATVIFFNNGEAVTRKDGILGRGLSRRDLDELLMMSPTASAPK